MSYIPPKPQPQWRQIVATFDEHMRYLFEERTGILCGDQEPDAQQAAYGIQDAREWKKRWSEEGK